MDVETETTRDWAKDVDTETPSRLSLISAPSHDVYEANLNRQTGKHRGPVDALTENLLTSFLK